MILTSPRGRPKQGALNLGHPLTRGMVGCFHLDAGPLINLVTNQVLTLHGTPTNTIGDGPARKFSAADTDFYDVPGDNVSTSPFNFTTNFTVLVTALDTDQSLNMQPVSRVSGSASGWNLQYSTTHGSGPYNCYFEWNNPAATTNTTAWACRTPGIVNHLAFSGNTSNGLLTCYSNGSQATTVTDGSATGYTGIVSNAASKLTIGTDSDAGSSRGFTNGLSRVVLWNRTLTPREMALVTNPQTAYSYIKPTMFFSFQAPQGASQAFPCGGGVY